MKIIVVFILFMIFYSPACYAESALFPDDDESPIYIELTGDEQDKAEESPIYQKYQIVCRLCSAIKENTILEKALKIDMQYAKKYKVINYSRRDNTVQTIKQNDFFILSGNKEYKKKYGKGFKKSECNLVYSDDCEGALFGMAAKILGKVPWEVSDVYPKP